MKDGENGQQGKEDFLGRFTAQGFSLDDTEDKDIMRFLMDICSGRKSGSAEAREMLMGELGSVARLLFAFPAELYENGAMNSAAVRRLKLISAMMVQAELEKLGDMIPADDEAAVKRYISLLFLPHTEEAVYIIPIVGKRLGKPYLLSRGTDISVDIDMEKILSYLRSCHGCREFLISHSHPRDISAPSEQDISATEQIFGYMYSCGYTLKAHYIAGTDGTAKAEFNDNPVRYFFS